jgi:hypothetical protein
VRRPELKAFATYTRDRKKYENERFRTTRDRAGLQPADWYVLDVHPVDIVMLRPDGSTAHARMIGWHDIATNRFACDLVLCEPGTGIRNAHMIKSLCNRLQEPTWGMPKTLYIDNGQENRFADHLEDALQLVAQLRGDDGRTTRVVRALPYQGQSKPIEGMFAVGERMLRGIPGHTGGDRMNKKTERVGRPTLPFSGTLDELDALIRGRMLEMEIYPMGGALRGKSPREAYEAAVAAGWQPVLVDTRQIRTVFAIDKVCTITKGVIAYAGRKWCCQELAGYFENKIIARAPKYWEPEQLPLLHLKTRELIGMAEPVGAYAFDDLEGAKLSSRKNGLRRRAIRDAVADVPDLDTVKAGIEIAATIPLPTIAAPIAHIGISAEAAAIAELASETPVERASRQREKNIQAQRRQSAALERVTKAISGR